MRLRNLTLSGVILIVLAFTIGMAGAIENGMGNETPTVNVTGNSTGYTNCRSKCYSAPERMMMRLKMKV